MRSILALSVHDEKKRRVAYARCLTALMIFAQVKLERLRDVQEGVVIPGGSNREAWVFTRELN